jgi:biopolymer transport protein ExbB/TolQ
MMETGLFSWIDLAMNALEIAALGAILWQFTYLRRDLRALVRVVRRMDRKTPERKTRAFVAEVEAERAEMQASRGGQ